MNLNSALELPAHGYIYREKSGGTLAVEDGYEGRLLQWRDSALEQGLAEMKDSPEYEEIPGYLDLIEGRHYQSPATIPNWKSKFTDNRIAKARVDALAYLTDIRPTIDISTRVEDYKDAARIMKDVLHAEWSERRMDVALEEVLDHALLGTGYWKVSCAYPGEFSVLACGIDTVIPIQQGKDLQDSTAILYRAFRPPHYFQSRWPERSIGIEREANPGMLGIQSNQYSRPWNIQEYSWNSMSPSMRYHKARQSPSSSVQDQWSNFPLIELQEYWIEDWHVNPYDFPVIVKDPYRDLDAHNYWYRVQPGERLYPRKRLIVFAGDRVMYDGPSPYWHGLFPFAKLRLNPVVWSSCGLSAYRDLKPLNNSINRIGSGIELLVDKAMNPTVITKDGAVNATSWEKFFAGRPGAKLKLTPISNPATDVRFIDPPQLPGYVEGQRQYLLAAFREQSGQLDMGSMAKKKQLPGGDTIEQYKDSMTAARRREIKNLGYFLEDAGRIAMPCIGQYFSRGRREEMFGADGLTKADFDYKPGSMYSWSGLPEEFHRNFTLFVESGSMHQGSKDRNKQVAMLLRKSHDISRAELMRQLDAGIDVARNEAELAKETPPPQPARGQGRSERMTRGAQNGKPY